MGLDIANPQEFLEEARQAVAAYRTVQEELATQTEEEKQLKRSLEQARREISEKIEKTIRSRGEELCETYDKQLSQVNSRLKKIQNQREKAKNQGIKGRIERETEPYRTENKEMKRQMLAVLEKDHAPHFCASGFFFSLYMPRNLSEFVRLVLAFLMLFAALPVGIYHFIPQHKMYMLCIIYVLDILIFGGLYVWIGNMTTGKHRDAIRKAREIRNQILKNLRKISSVKREIHRDSSEAGYNLEEFDDEITRAQQDRNEIIAKKQSAQNTFETVTRNIISDEIETAARPAIDELSQKLSEVAGRRAELETEEKDQALQLSECYEQYLGKKHMNETDIAKLSELLQAGSASSLIDAVAKLEHPES